MLMWPADWNIGITCASSVSELRMRFGDLVDIQSQFDLKVSRPTAPLDPTQLEKLGAVPFVRNRQQFQIYLFFAKLSDG
jgi:hypothetical protein